MYTRIRHRVVDKALAALSGGFLDRAKCYFGGGTRIVLELKEYRESADIDLLCSDRNGYRALRSTVTNVSLGEISARPIKLAREVRADQYGIRTVLQIGEQLIKFEVLNEARIDLSGVRMKKLHVPCLDKTCCFAEKILANDDRWIDESVLNRDIIDLAYMIEAWGADLFLEGMRRAREAYGDGVIKSVRSSARKLIEDKTYLKKCVDGLSVTQTSTLTAGLQRIAKTNWANKPDLKRAI
jgi:hypothetical protein